MDGLIIDEETAYYVIQQKRLNDIYIAPVVLSQNLGALAVRKDQEAMRLLLDTEILNMMTDGRNMYFCLKYLGTTLIASCLGNKY